MSRRGSHDLEVDGLEGYLNDTGAAADNRATIAWQWEVGLCKSVCSRRCAKLTWRRHVDERRSASSGRQPGHIHCMMASAASKEAVSKTQIPLLLAQSTCNNASDLATKLSLGQKTRVRKTRVRKGGPTGLSHYRRYSTVLCATAHDHRPGLCEYSCRVTWFDAV